MRSWGSMVVQSRMRRVPVGGLSEGSMLDSRWGEEGRHRWRGGGGSAMLVIDRKTDQISK